MEQKVDNFIIELQNMEYRLDEMQDKLDQLDAKLTQVVEALLGNSLTKSGGLVSEMSELKQRVVDLEKEKIKNDEFRKRTSWTIGIIVGIALIAQYLLNIYVNLKK